MLSLIMVSLHGKSVWDGKVLCVFTSCIISDSVIEAGLAWTLWHETLWSQSVLFSWMYKGWVSIFMQLLHRCAATPLFRHRQTSQTALGGGLWPPVNMQTWWASSSTARELTFQSQNRDLKILPEHCPTAVTQIWILNPTACQSSASEGKKTSNSKPRLQCHRHANAL